MYQGKKSSYIFTQMMQTSALKAELNNCI